MKSPYFLSAIFCLCLPFSTSAQITFSQPNSTLDPEAALFETYLNGVMAAQFNDFELAGVSLSVIRNGEPFLSKGYGYADIETKEPVDPARHLFRPGSISKLFTWTAVMQLMEQGRLDLDADVNQYLTQFQLPNNFDAPITLKHILTHTAGFEDGALGYLFSDSVDDLMPLAEVLATYMPEQVREPGTQSGYSNYATAVAGLIVANVSGMSFEEYVAQNIFSPLGMNNSTFEEPLPEHLAPDMAVGYENQSGGLEATGFEFIKNFGPAGALSTTADDMANFMIAHVNDGIYNGNRILRTDTAQLMHSQLFTHHPAVAGMAYGFYETIRNEVRFVGHGGDTLAFHSELIINPEDDFGFYLSFSSPEGALAREAVVNAIIDYFYPDPGPVFAFPALEGSTERMEQIAGAYRVNRRSYTKLEGLTALFSDLNFSAGEDGELINPIGRFFEIEPYVFQRQGGYETLVFTANSQGDIDQALLGAIPVMAFDKVSLLHQGSLHQGIIVLALVAAFFVSINAVRNRSQIVSDGAARLARRILLAASVTLLLFTIILGISIPNITQNDLLFNFPPSGTGIVLLLPIAFTLLAIISGVLIYPVWKSDSCNIWQRIRYTYVGVLFLALVLVFNYWNLLGWNYY